MLRIYAEALHRLRVRLNMYVVDPDVVTTDVMKSYHFRPLETVADSVYFSIGSL